MRRIWVLAAVFLLVATFAVYALLFKSSGKNSTLGADRAFAVENTEKIHKIFLANRLDTHTVLLEKTKTGWIYNTKYKARPNAVENLLKAISQVQMMYKPPLAAVPNMLQDLSTRGIKVEVYDKEDQLLKAYYVGGSTADERGTYMILEGEEQPYVTHLPSWEGNLRFRYNLKGDDWRDRSIFSTPLDDIASLSIEYPKQRELSFKIAREGRQYLVEPFYDLQRESAGQPQKAKIEAYLNHFKSIGAENFRNNYSIKDSIRQLTPFCTIALQTDTGEQQEVDLFPIIPTAEDVAAGKTEVERYYVNLNGEDFMLAQHRVLKEILRAYAYFYD